jgi:hypothetical protein
VVNYNNALPNADGVASHYWRMDDVYIVWFSKTLGNWKALVSTDVIHGFYWEVTHNGAKQETYLDTYRKLDNIAIPDGE